MQESFFAYISHEYGSTIWDLYLSKEVNAIEKIYQQAAHYVTLRRKMLQEAKSSTCQLTNSAVNLTGATCSR